MNNDIRPATILIIDDEAVIRQSFVDHLEDRGYRILSAENGHIGLEILERERPDLVLTDLRMPKMDGLQVIQRARQLFSDIPILVVSGTGRIGDAIQALRLGAWDYILKPVEDLSVLEHQVEKALEKVRLIRENHMYQENLESLVRDRTAQVEATNAALRESEARFRNLAQNSPNIIYILDLNTQKIVYLNRGNFLGYAQNELERPGFVCDVVHPDDAVRVAAHWQRVSQGQSDFIEYRLQVPLGHWEWVQSRETILSRDERDAPLQILVTLMIITERKQAEEALRESEEKYRALYEDNPSMYFTVDAEGVVLSVNQFGASQLGYEAAEIVGQSVLNIFYPDDREIFLQNLAQCFSKPGQLVQWELRKVHRDGSLLWVKETVRVVRLVDGSSVAFVVCGDVTKRVRAEAERELLLEQVQAQAKRIQQTIDSVPEGVFLLDVQGRVALANSTAKKDLALLSSARAGDSITHLGDRPLSEILTLTSTRGLWHEVHAGNRTFEVIARPMSKGPEPGDWVLVINDVTQQREVREKFARQERLAAVGQLAAGIAHDFNNIMAVIVLYAQMTARGKGLPGYVQERMQTINQQAQHATKLIRQILDFSRRSVLERQPLDLLPLLKEQIRLLERTLPENIKISLEYGVDEYTINADPTRMQQMLMNLAVNARDAMLHKEGGRLRISLTRTVKPQMLSRAVPGEEWVRIAVSDTGEGIPAEVLPHIFEPFFTTKRVGQGTGLGLAQVHGIVGSHEGLIDVRTKVGVGTSFIVYLPALLAHKSEPLVTEPHAVIHGRRETILVVEDNPTLRQVLVDTLESLNYQVLAATDGRTALDILSQQNRGSQPQIALVLSDLVMPEMGGHSLFNAIQQQGLDLPVVILSGHLVEDELEALREKGLAGWMLKPPDMEELALLLAEVLGKEA